MTNSQNTRYISQENEDMTIKFIIAIVLYFIISSMVKRNRQTQAENEVMQGNDPVTGQNPAYLATILHQAMNPSGIGLLMGVDGTDEETLFNVARQIKNYAQVAQKYRDLYNSDLTTDLENDLSKEDLNTFKALLGKGNAVVVGGNSTPTTKPKKFYSKSNNTPAYYVNRNQQGAYSVDFNRVVKTFKANELISDNKPVHSIKVTQSGTVYSVFEVPAWFGLSSQLFMVRIDLILER